MTSWRERARVVFAVTALAAAFVPVGASAAPEQCAPGELCVWEHDDFLGCFARLPEKDDNYTDGSPTWSTCGGRTPPKGHINDQISSYMNRTDRWVLFFPETKYRGFAVCGAPGAESPNIHNFGSWFGSSPDDKWSSHALWDKGQEPDHFAFDGGPCGAKDYD